MLVAFGEGGEPDQVYPIDYANACPDVAVTSLHYYFPWAMKALVRWSLFCMVTERPNQLDLDTRAYFDVADRADLSYADKLAEYRRLADDYLEAERYADWCATTLRHFDDIALEWFSGAEMDQVVVDTVRATFPPHEQEEFVAHFRGMVALWCRDEAARLSGTS
jgi:hypothetical protein